MKTGKCKATGKVKFRTKLDAEIALAKRAHDDKGEVRKYFCQRCKGWHLTSMRRTNY